jgi:hypothetical protein
LVVKACDSSYSPNFGTSHHLRATNPTRISDIGLPAAVITVGDNGVSSVRKQNQGRALLELVMNIPELRD